MARRQASRDLRCGLLVVHLPQSDPAPLQALAGSLARACEAEMEAATGAAWEVAVPLPRALDDSRTQSVADYLPKAMTAMTEGRLDLVVVLTDAPISGQDRTLVFGSHSRTARMAVMSTHRLLQDDAGHAARTLQDADVVANAQALLLHLAAHVVGLDHGKAGLMQPFRWQAGRPPEATRFSDAERARLRRRAHRVPDATLEGAGHLRSFAFHVASAARNPGQVLVPLARGRAFKIALAMPAMLTAALVPVFVLVFTAEIWDVALHLPWADALLFALAAWVAGTVYVTLVQNLLFPRKERETETEHSAVVNCVVVLCMMEALLGLMAFVFAVVWAIEAYVFPQQLMARWTGIDTTITRLDRLKLALFVATLGTLTAALGSGIDKQTFARHLALFSDRA